MPWKQQGGGGGPFGGGQGPWGRPPGGGGGGGGRGPMGQPPDFEDMLRRGQDRFRRLVPGGLRGGWGLIVLVVAVISLWMLSGFYRVQPDEQGVVLRFGEWTKTTLPGLNYHWPGPIESVITPKVTRVNRIEVGLRSVGETTRNLPVRDIQEESLMLTGDENIVDIDFTVFWVIKDAGNFLFNIRNPEATVKLTAESAMREVIGQTPIQSALTEGRNDIEQGTQTRVQQLLDDYGSGIEVRRVQLLKVDPPGPVIDAFVDVQRARADLERLRNEAEAYRNDILPRARGEAEKMIQDANAYREEITNKAKGEAERFIKVLESYQASKDVTTQRIYLETIEEVFRGMNKVIIDSSAQGGPGVVPYLPLPEIQKRAQQSADQEETTQ